MAFHDHGGPHDTLKHMPYGVYIVTTYSPESGEHGLTASWVMQVSKTPPLVAIALHKGSTTEHIVEKSGVFAVNILPATNTALAERFMTPIDRFNAPPFVGMTWGLMQLPLLDDAIGWLECRVQQKLDIGDHILFIGEVLGGRLRADDIPLTTVDSGLAYGGL